MNDFNFFAPYQGKQKQVVNKKIYIYTISAVVLIFILGTLIWNSVNIYITNKQIEKYKADINSPKLQAKITEANDINKKSQILSKYDVAIDSINNDIAKKNVVSSDILDKINLAVPKEVSFNNISLDESNISFNGQSKNRQAIGELQHNLKGLDIFEVVQVNSITGDEADSNYKFDLKCTLKDVEINENK
ncbi:PilN domain-containing protein [Clostridium sp. YIM B02505]|uniref:PilN domain-containing protein n=1 Tax=Clostridium yunnanense TaxID=2800325 RepID=A0ABS1EMD5_9CLOT|nr:PilN domain-containing protein [Clostridium yunnanense]MBK1810494.1 PilN domain-containing protein [Clostridium yunnanense]